MAVNAHAIALRECKLEITSFATLPAKPKMQAMFAQAAPVELVGKDLEKYDNMYAQLVTALNAPKGSTTRGMGPDKASRARNALWKLWYEAQRLNAAAGGQGIAVGNGGAAAIGAVAAIGGGAVNGGAAANGGAVAGGWVAVNHAGGQGVTVNVAGDNGEGNAEDEADADGATVDGAGDGATSSVENDGSGAGASDGMGIGVQGAAVEGAGDSATSNDEDDVDVAGASDGMGNGFQGTEEEDVDGAGDDTGNGAGYSEEMSGVVGTGDGMDNGASAGYSEEMSGVEMTGEQGAQPHTDTYSAGYLVAQQVAAIAAREGKGWSAGYDAGFADAMTARGLVRL